MALSIVLDDTTTLASDGSTITVVDATGAYAVTDNEGGYGTPNPEREDLFLLVAAFKLSSPDQLTGVVVRPYDGLVDASFIIEVDGDQLYRTNVIPIDSGVPSGSFAVGTVYHDPSLALILKTITADTIVGAETLIDLSQETPFTSEQIEAVLVAIGNTADADKYDLVNYNYLVQRAFLVYQLYADDCYKEEKERLLTAMGFINESARNNAAAERYYDSADNMDHINELVSTIPDIT